MLQALVNTTPPPPLATSRSHAEHVMLEATFAIQCWVTTDDHSKGHDPELPAVKVLSATAVENTQIARIMSPIVRQGEGARHS